MSKILPEAAVNRADKILFNSYQKNKSLAILFHSLMGGELPLFAIDSVNKYLKVHSYDEICLYSMNKDLPVLCPNCAVYNTTEIFNFTGHILATDIPSWQVSLNSPSKNKCLYIYDIMRLNNIPKELVDSINKSKVKIFTRTAEHVNYLRKLGFNVEDKTIKYFDIGEICKILQF
jgi:hypothetical protein